MPVNIFRKEYVTEREKKRLEKNIGAGRKRIIPFQNVL